jgi:hypothetical protein
LRDGFDNLTPDAALSIWLTAEAPRRRVIAEAFELEPDEELLRALIAPRGGTA